ncbi:MAG: YqiJ family protein [Chitinispirillaceae bacterium]
MFELILSGDNLPFTVALMLMLLLSLLELASFVGGVGLGTFLDSLAPEIPDVDLDIEAGAPTFLGWLGMGKVPFAIILLIFLSSFGFIGLALQSAVHSLFGIYLPWFLALWAPLFLTLPVIRVVSGVLSKYLLKDETDAVSEGTFVGKVAVIIRGTAKPGQPAEAKLQDRHGCTHYILVEPEESELEFSQSKQVLIVKKIGALYKVIEAPASVLSSS